MLAPAVIEKAEIDHRARFQVVVDLIASITRAQCRIRSRLHARVLTAAVVNQAFVDEIAGPIIKAERKSFIAGAIDFARSHHVAVLTAAAIKGQAAIHRRACFIVRVEGIPSVAGACVGAGGCRDTDVLASAVCCQAFVNGGARLEV